jgi:fermentation-respiration switch protein FrsA (DUF1100 family)
MTSPKKIRYGLGLFLVVSGILGIFLFLKIENKLIFYPDRFPIGNWEPVAINPEDAWIETEDGEKIHGWLVTAKNQRAIALYSHGNGGNITGLADYLKILSEKLNITVLAYDYRGYGKSSGSPGLKGVLLDAKDATTWLAKKTGVAEKDIIQIGRSLGGGIATQTAVSFQSRGLILENTFASISAMGKRIYPWLPVNLLLSKDFNSLKTIKEFKGSLLLIHGDQDEIIPKEMGDELYQAANQPKKFLNITGGRHNDFPPPYYFIAIDELIQSL